MRGRLYLQDGVAQGEAALDDSRASRRRPTISRASSRAISSPTNPTPASSQRLARIFADTDGDLAAAARALIVDPVAWRAPATKIRNPWELRVAAYRAFGRDPNDPAPALNALNLLGMPLWQPAGPNGFSDEAAAWTSPEGMKTRARTRRAIRPSGEERAAAARARRRHAGTATPPTPTREAIERAESVEQAYALLILSPEFQRR